MTVRLERFAGKKHAATVGTFESKHKSRQGALTGTGAAGHEKVRSLRDGQIDSAETTFSTEVNRNVL